MTRLQFILRAQNEYSIQSPYLYALATRVLLPRLGREGRRRAGMGRGDRCAELRYKLADHYGRPWEGNRMRLADGSLLTLVEAPHRDGARERGWDELVKEPGTTLSVDLFYAGLAFSSTKLGKQHFLLR